MSERLRAFLIVVVCVLALLISIGSHGQNYSDNRVDVSWPNCSLKGDNEFSSGIIGVTGGLDFTRNPCLSQETTWFSNYALYMNTGYPGKSYGIKFVAFPKDCTRTEYTCLAFNYGYNAAEYAIKYSDNQLAHSSVWWLDVETDNSWTLHPSINRAVIQGALDAVKQVPFVTTVGIYSSSGQWNFLTGSWQNKLPTWIGTGSKSKDVAVDFCKTSSFTGGPVSLSQYTRKLDIDISCAQRGHTIGNYH